MIRISAVLPLSILLIACATSAQAQQMEHNAFLNKPVFSTEELVKQVGSDPKVLSRFVKHFMMDKDRLRRYFTTLNLTPLQKSRKYLVYNVDKNLVVRKKMLTMKKGTLVFSDKKGKPILRRSCGNPMVAYLPPIGTTSSRFAPVKPADAEVTVIEPEMMAAPSTPPESLAETSVPPTIVETPTAPAPSGGPASPPTRGFSPPRPPSIPPLNPAALGGALAGLNSLVPPKREVPPVPDPATLLTLLGGMGAYGLRRRRSRNESSV
jgi:hypothetical protein